MLKAGILKKKFYILHQDIAKINETKGEAVMGTNPQSLNFQLTCYARKHPKNKILNLWTFTIRRVKLPNHAEVNQLRRVSSKNYLLRKTTSTLANFQGKKPKALFS